MARSRKKALKAPPDDQLSQQSSLPLGGISPVPGMFGFGGIDGGGADPFRCDQSFLSYWRMLQNPVARFARAMFFAPILASDWEYEPNDPATDKALAKKLSDLLRRNLSPLRPTIVEHCGRGQDLGRAPFEPVWEVAGSEYRLTDMVPLPVELSGVYRNAQGKFAGISTALLTPGQTIAQFQQSLTDTSGDFIPGLAAPYKAFLYIYDDYARILVGRPWLENIRTTAWADWVDAYRQLNGLGQLLSGIHACITAPAGNIPGVLDSAGKPVSWQSACKAIADAFNAGAKFVYLPSYAVPVETGATVDVMKMIMTLIKSSAINFQQLDFGNNAAAIEGQLQRIAHDEALIFMGRLLSPRVGLESKNGSRADSGHHTESASIVIEGSNDDIARQMQPMVDAVLALNMGPEYVGSMRIKCPPLEREKLDKQIELVLGAIQSQNVEAAQEILDTVDVTKFLRECDFATIRDFNSANIKAAVQAKNDAALKAKQDAIDAQPQPTNSKPVNGNGKAALRLSHINRVAKYTDER